VAEASARVRAKALAVASDLLTVDSSELDLIDGRIVVAAAQHGGPLALGEVATAAERAGEPLVATAYFESPTVTWSRGAHAAIVAVDVETGVVEVLRYVAVHDCGREINPMIVAGQVRGGIAQGLGGALHEQVHYDEEGQLLSASLADYLLPTAVEVPPIVLESLETPSGLNPLGLRGVGEGGAIAPPAVIANAVDDALVGQGALVRRTPLTPEYVLSLAGAIPADVRYGR
jgi:carbon-monoxide dehydrogenase large subunit